MAFYFRLVYFHLNNICRPENCHSRAERKQILLKSSQRTTRRSWTQPAPWGGELTTTLLWCIQMQKCCVFGSADATRGRSPSKPLARRLLWDRKQECLIESSSAAPLQSLLAGCLYLKGLPEESSHLAQRSHRSPHHSSGRLSGLRSIRQQAAPAWIVMATGLGLWVWS